MSEVIYYDDVGKGYSDETKCNRVCAKCSISPTSHFVLAKSGALFKTDASLKDKNKDGWRLISVNENCFKLYIEYLKGDGEFRYYEALRQL